VQRRACLATGVQVLVAGSNEEDEDPFLSRLQDTGDALLAEEGSGSGGGPSSDDDLGLDEDEDEDDEDEDEDSFEDVGGGGGGGGKRRRRDRRRRRRRREGEGKGTPWAGATTRRAGQAAARRAAGAPAAPHGVLQPGVLLRAPGGSTLYDMAHLLRKDTSEHLW